MDNPLPLSPSFLCVTKGSKHESGLGPPDFQRFTEVIINRWIMCPTGRKRNNLSDVTSDE